MNRIAPPSPPDDQHPLLEVGDLTIGDPGLKTERRIVSGLNLAVQKGEAIAIVGESGSGKSMTARAIVGLLPPGLGAQGSVTLDGQELLGADERKLRAIRGTRVGLVFQDPFTMLNPLLRTGRHITEALRDERGKRLRGRDARAEAIRRLQEVGIADPNVADRYPFELSGGMRQRVGIAAALARDPEVLIADEPTTALDVTTQKEILGLLKSLQASRGMALILITHDLRVAFSMCDRICVLYAGAQLEMGPAARIEDDPSHPYTLGLLLSEPPPEHRVETLEAIAGSVPRGEEVRDRCAFAARCRWCRPECEAGAPPLREVDGEVLSACIRLSEIRPELRAYRRRRAAAAGDAHVGDDEPPALLEVRDVHKAFGRASEGTLAHAVAGASIRVAPGESVGIVGESGSGKTTLARCLVGLETPTEGQIILDGIDASDVSRLSRSDLERFRGTIQIVFQDPYSSLNPVRTVGATLREALRVRRKQVVDIDEQVAQLLERVGLPSQYSSRKPAALSGGERQRVAIARSLATEPKLLICDEPVSALDVSVQAQVLNLLSEVRSASQLAYLFITHDLAVVRQIADRIYVMRRGEIVEHGPVAQILDQPGHEYTKSLVASIPRTDVDWLGSGQADLAQAPR